MGFLDFFFGPPQPPPGFKWDNQNKNFIVTDARDANAGVAGSPYSAGDKVNPANGKIVGGGKGKAAALDAVDWEAPETAEGCLTGTEVHSDGNCYPIECDKGFGFDMSAGYCVAAEVVDEAVDESPPKKGGGKNKRGNNRVKSAEREINALESQIAKLAASGKASDRRNAQALEQQRKQLQRQAAQPQQGPDGPDLLSYAPYAAGGLVVAGGLYYLWTR